MAESIHVTHQYSGFSVAYGWIPAEFGGPDETEPAMFLIRDRPKREKRLIKTLNQALQDDTDRKDRLVHGIGLSSAHKYANSKTGGPTDYLMTQALVIATRWWGSPPVKSEWAKVVTAILDCLPELVRMPPRRPPTQQEVANRIDREIDFVAVDGQKILQT